MKQLFFFLLLPIFGISQKNITEFPPYAEMIHHFLENYSLPTAEYYSMRIQKTPKGYLIIRETQNEEIIFWSKEKEEYQALNFENYKGEFPTRIYNQLSRMGHMYNENLYYGYDNWSYDAIEALEEIKDPSDKELYQLGRAYSHAACGLLSPARGYTRKDLQFDLPKRRNALSKEQLESYNTLQRLGNKAFEKLAKRNPTMPTFVGDMAAKYGHEVMGGYLNLLIHHNEVEAKKELIPNLYEAHHIEYAKNLLSSCEQNAILFTWGDGDTYPLYYVQATEGYRTDVTVINSTLTYTEAYIRLLKDGFLGSKAISFPFSEDFYQDEKNNSFTTFDGPQTLTLKEMIQWINQPENYKNKGPYSFSYPSTETRIPLDKEDLIKRKIITEEEKQKIPHKILLKMPNRVMKNEFAMWGIVDEHLWERPIHFSNTCRKEFYKPFENHVTQKGLTFQITPRKIERIFAQTLGAVDLPSNRNYLLKEFELKSSKKVAGSFGFICNSYIRSFSMTVNQALQQGEIQTAKKIQDRYFDLFLPDKIGYQPNHFEMIMTLYEVDPNQATKRMSKFLDLAIEEKEKKETLTIYYDRLMAISKKHVLHKLTQKLEKVLD